MRKCFEPNFYNEVVRISENLGTAPENLLSVISFETGGTFSPSIKNAVNGKATGLIQFMPNTASSLGTSTNELAKMTATEQLSFVERYLSPFAGKINNLSDLYMAVFMPKFITSSDNTEIAQEGGTVYSQNSGLDINKDGAITKSEASTKVTGHLKSVLETPICELGSGS